MRQFKKYLLSFFLFLSTSLFPIKFLHLSFHRGCIDEFDCIARELGLDITSVFVQEWAFKGEFDGETVGNAVYNITHERALKVWEHSREYFEKFDVIITSDTVPLTRIFLQNNWKKPMIIWVSNRFDYYHATPGEAKFPDHEYLDLIKDAAKNSNVYFVSYTPIERFYAKDKYNIDWGDVVIKPIGFPSKSFNKNAFIPDYINKKDVFFIPPYLNDGSLKIVEKCNDMGIQCYRGQYNGSEDLKDFKAIIHFPYGWSNFALFQNIQLGLPYFLPSKRFFLELFISEGLWWQNSEYIDHIEKSEWYSPDNQDCFVYFDSWDDLIKKIKETNFQSLKNKTSAFGTLHKQCMLNRWKQVINDVKSIFL